MDSRLSRVESELEIVKTEVVNLRLQQLKLETTTEAIKEELSGIRSNTTWLLRTVVGAITLALIDVVLLK